MPQRASDRLPQRTTVVSSRTHVSRSAKLQGKHIVYKRIVESKEKNPVLIIGVLLRMLTMETSTLKDEAAAELVKLEASLARTPTDNEAVRLRMLIHDNLAEACLAAKKCDEALRRSQISIELKQRLYSSYHVSLVRNCQLAASCSFQTKDYRSAVNYYEKAIEIQLDNMPSDHAEIRANYFRMGDCYCLMDKAELARELYDRAQAAEDTDNDDDEKKVECGAAVLVHMHSHLAEMYARQKDFTLARTHQNLKLNMQLEILPPLVVQLIVETITTSITWHRLETVLKSRVDVTHGENFARALRNMISIRLGLARALCQANQRTDDEDDATTIYEQTIELELKLTLFEPTDNQRLSVRYEELSRAYAKLYPSMADAIRENLTKALTETDGLHRQRAFEYRLGRLNYDEGNYFDANDHWKKALEKVKASEPMIKSIIEKLIEKNKENLTASEDNSDEGADDGNNGDEDSDEEKTDQSRVQSGVSQRPSTAKSVNTAETPEELAAAYLDLGEDENALKYLKRHASKLETTLKVTLPEKRPESDRLPLVKFFHGLLCETIDSAETKEIQDKKHWISLLDAHKQIFTMAVRMQDSPEEVIKASSATLHIAQSSCTICPILSSRCSISSSIHFRGKFSALSLRQNKQQISLCASLLTIKPTTNRPKHSTSTVNYRQISPIEMRSKMRSIMVF